MMDKQLRETDVNSNGLSRRIAQWVNLLILHIKRSSMRPSSIRQISGADLSVPSGGENKDPGDRASSPLRMGQTAELNAWFIRMRWIACIVAAVLTNVTIRIFGYLDDRTLLPLNLLVLGLLLSNLLFTLFLKKGWLSNILSEIQVGVDLIILTVMLHYSGGIENALSFVFLFHTIIGGIIFPRWKCYVIVAVSAVLYGGLAFLELTGFINHYTLLVFPHGEGHELIHAAHDPVYVASLVAMQIIFMILTALFITSIMEQLRQTEKKRWTDRQRLESVVQATGAGLAILDKKLRPVWLNDRIRTWLGLDDKVIGTSSHRMDKWTGGEDGPAIQTFNDRITRIVERKITDDNNRTRFFQVTTAPLTDTDGHVYQVAELVQDITLRKTAEAEMAHEGKMAMLGKVAAGIAHEVGNPLASIDTRLQLMEETREIDFIENSIKLIRRQLARISRTIHAVTQFARPTKSDWSSCMINDLVMEAINVFKFHQQAKLCKIESRLDPKVNETMGSRDQLMHIFINLGINGLEAMPDGGTLLIRTRVRDANILIEFSDTGEGMSEEVSSKIFEPFFSTKDKGLGLGLSIVQSFVIAHNGDIRVTSEPGRGTTFTVSLPIMSDSEQSGNGGSGG